MSHTRPATVWRWHRQGLIPSSRPPGTRGILIEREGFMRWLAGAAGMRRPCGYHGRGGHCPDCGANGYRSENHLPGCFFREKAQP